MPKKRERKKDHKEAEIFRIKRGYSYVLRISACKFSKPADTEEKIFKAVPCMLFCECSLSNISFAWISYHYKSTNIRQSESDGSNY